MKLTITEYKKWDRWIAEHGLTSAHNKGDEKAIERAARVQGLKEHEIAELMTACFGSSVSATIIPIYGDSFKKEMTAKLGSAIYRQCKDLDKEMVNLRSIVYNSQGPAAPLTIDQFEEAIRLYGSSGGRRNLLDYLFWVVDNSAATNNKEWYGTFR